MSDQWSDAGVNPKDAIGRAKPGLAFLPMQPIFEAGQVMKLGAEKYGPYNWREANISASVYYDAIHRHLLRWWEGDTHDDESKCHHLAHIIANCSLYLDAVHNQTNIDDRPKVSAGCGF
jgi:hypothetical protein